MKFFNKSHKTRKSITVFLLLALLFSICLPRQNVSAAAKAPWIVLSKYSNTMKIGQEFYLTAVTSDLSIPTYSSSSRAIASVDSYGLVTAKKAGTCRISVKSGKSIAYCMITVQKTQITLNKTALSLNQGDRFSLKATTSNGSIPTFKSSKSSIAEIDYNGKITAKKAGECTITAKADQSEAVCKVKVMPTKITLNQNSVSMENGASFQLKATTSNGSPVSFRTSKKSVAVVDNNGKITAVKPGEAIITVKADQSEVCCKVTVRKPSITLSEKKCSLKAGKSKKITAKVSSGLPPKWSSSKSSVAKVDQNGKITAVKKGSATITAKVDGVTATCHVTVTKK